MFKPNIYLLLNISRTKPNNNLITSSFKNDAINLVNWLGIDLADGNSSLVLSQAGTWVSNGSPSLPLNSVQYNNAGALFGDAFFTRDSTTKDTVINTPISSGVTAGFLSNVGLGLAAIRFEDTNTGEFSSIAVESGGLLSTYSTDGTVEWATQLSDSEFQFINSSTSDRFLHLDVGNGSYGIGDLDTSSNGTFISINDVTQTVEITNIPAYADNATAFAAIGANKLYYTDVAGEYILKLSH